MNKTISKVKALGIIFIVLMLLFSAFAFAGCGEETEETNYYTLPSVEVGETFEITLLDPYADGGWSWEYDISPSSGIEYVTMKFIADNPDPDVYGGGGTEIFTFKATKTGDYKIKFKYQRPWDSSSLKETNIYEIRVVK